MKIKSTKGITVTPKPLVAKATAFDPKIWLADSFSEDWYKDALHEVQTGKDHNSIRREIIFATCFAESYIFEWAMQNLKIEEINDYFPGEPRSQNDPRYRRNLQEKWKQIPIELYKAGKINVKPKLDLSGLGTLLEYRHGLVHASASRPASSSQTKKTKPFPTKDMLKKLETGWAVKIVAKLVINLHQSIDTSIPSYVVIP